MCTEFARRSLAANFLDFRTQIFHVSSALEVRQRLTVALGHPRRVWECEEGRKYPGWVFLLARGV